MTNECNILIYSVFIFFCYSFIILNMALPLFHIEMPFMFNSFSYYGGKDNHFCTKCGYWRLKINSLP